MNVRVKKHTPSVRRSEDGIERRKREVSVETSGRGTSRREIPFETLTLARLNHAGVGILWGGGCFGDSQDKREQKGVSGVWAWIVVHAEKMLLLLQSARVCGRSPQLPDRRPARRPSVPGSRLYRIAAIDGEARGISYGVTWRDRLMSPKL